MEVHSSVKNLRSSKKLYSEYSADRSIIGLEDQDHSGQPGPEYVFLSHEVFSFIENTQEEERASEQRQPTCNCRPPDHLT